MAELLRQYFRIAFLMGRPQDLPGGSAQMRVGIVLAFVTYVVALLDAHGIGRAVAHVLLDLGLTALVLYVALVASGHPGRFEQAFGGLCGASAFVNAAAIPIYLSRRSVVDGPPSVTDALAEFVLLVWSLSLLAHVLRHTFELGIGTSIVIAFVFVLALVSLMGVVLPPPLPPPMLEEAASIEGAARLAVTAVPLGHERTAML